MKMDIARIRWARFFHEDGKCKKHVKTNPIVIPKDKSRKSPFFDGVFSNLGPVSLSLFLSLSRSFSRSPFLSVSLSLTHSFFLHVIVAFLQIIHGSVLADALYGKDCQNSTFLLDFLERASLHDSRNFSTIASTSLRCDHLHDPSYFRVPRDPRWHSMEVPASTHPIVRAMPFILNVAGLNGTKIRKGKTRRKGKRSETNPECTFDIAKERGVALGVWKLFRRRFKMAGRLSGERSKNFQWQFFLRTADEPTAKLKPSTRVKTYARIQRNK